MDHCSIVRVWEEQALKLSCSRCVRSASTSTRNRSCCSGKPLHQELHLLRQGTGSSWFHEQTGTGTEEGDGLTPPGGGEDREIRFSRASCRDRQQDTMSTTLLT
ncbi:unnamed protein product [Arctogadus glacialis]